MVVDSSERYDGNSSRRYPRALDLDRAPLSSQRISASDRQPNIHLIRPVYPLFIPASCPMFATSVSSC